MFKNKDPFRKFDVPIIYNGKRLIMTVLLSAWDIQNIEYLSVYYSNDYRHTNRPVQLGMIVDLYRNHENENFIPVHFKDGGLRDICRTLTGMTAEQFKYQDLSWIPETFNRNYHILLASSKYRKYLGGDIEGIIKEIFGLSADDFLYVLLSIYGLCISSPNPLSILEKLYRRNEKTVLTKENILNIIKYYSCTYDQLRKSPFNKQLLYSKTRFISGIKFISYCNDYRQWPLLVYSRLLC